MAANLINAAKQACKPLYCRSLRKSGNIFKNGGQQTRKMGDQRTMEIKESRYEWEQWKDHLKFHFGLHAIPMGLLITYFNLTKGRCELREIPEGYRPQYWEYYKHPITQFMARNFYRSPEETYERHLHVVNLENEKRKLRILEQKVRKLQAQRGDYKGWYYVPQNTQQVYKGRQVYKDTREQDGVV